ncbi:MAG: type II toxin-antitoxin system RelE/ParE family toxin [Elusimicrobia bacterium]|nr:type II toxin-antitoxin system RelE/ParE family toxin [Elusimicrobiota bacterium]
MIPLEIFQYETSSGKSPYREWFLSLKDGMVRSRIWARVDRLALGNPGDYKSLGQGVYELRLDFGPGFRIYYAPVKTILVLLLTGGDKSTQVSDIRQAKEYWKDFKRRNP